MLDLCSWPNVLVQSAIRRPSGINDHASCVGLPKCERAHAALSYAIALAQGGEAGPPQLGWVCLARCCAAPPFPVAQHVLELRGFANPVGLGRGVGSAWRSLVLALL
jgi:hypothetical protein